MSTPLLLAIVTATGTLLGWAANHILTERRDRVNRRSAAALKFIERQLEELYGPLTFLIIEGRGAAVDFVDALGREPVFEGKNALNEDEARLWLLWAEHDLLPRNEKIQQLLMAKTHLIEGDKLPLSFVEFLDYYNSWRMSHLQWTKERIKYNWRSKISWPASFSEEVLNTFKALKVRHNRIMTKMYK